MNTSVNQVFYVVSYEQIKAQIQTEELKKINKRK